MKIIANYRILFYIVGLLGSHVILSAGFFAVNIEFSANISQDIVIRLNDGVIVVTWGPHGVFAPRFGLSFLSQQKRFITMSNKYSLGLQWPRWINWHIVKVIEIPLWVIIIPFLSIIVLAAMSQGTVYTTSTCRLCSYNLIGNESGRCPECGNLCTMRPRSGR